MTADVLIIGLGGMGSATALALAQRGVRVIGLDQFALGHTHGSSHGRTRIIRRAYYEAPEYVPLVELAYAGWYDLEQSTGQHLLTTCPLLSVGTAESEMIAGVLRSASEHIIPVEQLDAAGIRARYPQFRFADDYCGVIEAGAGILAVDDCVRAMQDEARRLGADLHEGEAVEECLANGGGAMVGTRRGTYSVAQVIVTAGPWAMRWLGATVPLTVMRQPVHWFRPPASGDYRRDRFPIFLADLPGGIFYGLPMLDPDGVKLAQHYGQPEVSGPDGVTELTDADADPSRRFLARHLPDIGGEVAASSLCRYTLTPDRHFAIGRHPDCPAILVAAGFSGHGFKFAPAVGEALADLATAGRTDLPIRPFAPSRFGGVAWD